MNKKFKYYAIIWAILLAVFNVICFATPSEAAGMNKFGGAFWAGYIFITVAFVGQIICASMAFKADNLKKLFYNIPLIRVSYTGLILSLVFGTICMAVPNLPNWIGIIVCLLVLVFTAIAVIKAKAVSDAVENTDNKVKAQTLFVKSLTVDAESLLARAVTPEAKEVCKKVYEAVRYSDPMTNDALAGIESQISIKFSEFQKAVINNAENVNELAEQIVVLINNRNKKLKVLK